MGNPIKRKKLRRMEAFLASQKQENVKQELPNGLVFVEEKKEAVVELPKQELVEEEVKQEVTVEEVKEELVAVEELKEEVKEEKPGKKKKSLQAD